MAFHPYPQLIPYLFNGSGFGPPAGVTQPSAWPWVDHLVSGLHPATESPCSDSLSLRLPYSVKLATECKSLTHYTKGTQSPLLQTPSGCFRRADSRLLSTQCSLSLTPLRSNPAVTLPLPNERFIRPFHSFLHLLSRIAARCSSKESRRFHSFLFLLSRIATRCSSKEGA